MLSSRTVASLKRVYGSLLPPVVTNPRHLAYLSSEVPSPLWLPSSLSKVAAPAGPSASSAGASSSSIPSSTSGSAAHTDAFSYTCGRTTRETIRKSRTHLSVIAPSYSVVLPSSLSYLSSSSLSPSTSAFAASKSSTQVFIPRAIWTEYVRLFRTGRHIPARVYELEQEADENPDDANVQATYLSALSAYMPTEVIRRCESNLYASNTKVDRIYVAAKLAVQKVDGLTGARAGVSSSLHSSSLDHSARGSFEDDRHGFRDNLHDNYANYHNNSHSSYANAPALGSEGNPMVVKVSALDGEGMKEGRQQGLKLLKQILVFSMVCGGIYVIYTTLIKPYAVAVGKNTENVFQEYSPSQIKVRFADIQGCDEAKAELMEIVDFLQNTDKYNTLGGELPKGVLLVGEPGTGKTLLAKAIAGEANVPFFYQSGASFEEMFVGVGAGRVRKLFEAAKRKAPCIVFIDEFDAVGGKRDARGVQQHTRQTINELLTAMDGFKSTEGIIVIAATNLKKVLDPALLRPGRFDKTVHMPTPDVKGRLNILEMYAKKNFKCEKAIDMRQIARGTVGMTGADLYNLLNSAAVHAAKAGKSSIHLEDIEYAKDKILLGPERKSNVIPESEKKVTAYHESGHALVACNTAGSAPIHKATIMPRGNALGLVMQLPESDQWLSSRQQMLAWMDVAMGGRIAEELIFGQDKVTAGASSDISKATGIARNMVINYGMGQKTGFLSLGGGDGGFQYEHLSAETKQLVDEDVKTLVTDSYKRAKTIITTQEADLHRLAKALLKYETLDGEEVRKVLKGEDIKKGDPSLYGDDMYYPTPTATATPTGPGLPIPPLAPSSHNNLKD